MHIIFHAYSFTCTFVLESGYGFIGGVFCLFMLQQEGVFVINCTSLTVSHSPNFWRQEQPICYNVIYMSSQIKKGDHDLLFIINT